MSRPAAVLLTVPVGVVCAVALAACDSGEAVDTPAVPTMEATTDADCEQAIPASAVATLGWSGDGEASYSVRGCRRTAEEGYLQVRELTVPGGAGDPEAAQAEFDARCAELDSSPDPDSTTEEPATGMLVTWLGEDVTACAVEPDEGVGLSKVLLLTPTGRLAELWVAALEPTDQELVREAVAELTEAASAGA